MAKVKEETFSSVKTEFVEFIPQTMDYMKYEISEICNRKISNTHVKNLEESFNEYGTAAATITVVETNITGKLSRIKADGQHSCIAAQRLNLPLNIVVVRLKEDTSLNLAKYVAKLNNTSKNWTSKNYLDVYSDNKVDNFEFFKTKMKETGLSLYDICYIYLGEGKQIKAVKNGEISIVNKQDSDNFLEAVMLVKHIIPNNSNGRRALYRIFRQCKNYKKMAKAMIKASDLITFDAKETVFYKQLVEIYNNTF